MSRITIIGAMLFSAGLISMNAGPADAASIIDTSRTSAQGQIKAGVKGQGGVFDCRPNLKGKCNKKKAGFIYDTTGGKTLTIHKPTGGKK